MAYPVRPTLQTLIDRVVGDVSSRTDGSAYVKRAMERVLSIVQAGVAHGLYGRLDWLRAQLFPTRCELDALLEWGEWLEIPRKDASQAVRTATFAGVDGTALPTNTSLRAADGALWTVTAGGTVSGGSVTVTARADVAGTAGNLAPGAALTIVSPIAGITSAGTVTAVVTDGADIEDVELYRARVIDEAREPESGGGIGDYAKWAKEVAGVTRAWEFPHRMGIGTVSVGFVRDKDGASIFPDAGEIAAVQAYIDSKRPTDMRAAYVQSPIAKPVNLTIALRPNTAEVRAAVDKSLAALFKTTDLEVALDLSSISESVSSSSGQEAHSLTSVSSLVPGTWELLTLGTVNYTTLA